MGGGGEGKESRKGGEKEREREGLSGQRAREKVGRGERIG